MHNKFIPKYYNNNKFEIQRKGPVFMMYEHTFI